MKSVRPESPSVHTKFATTRTEMAAALIERDDEIDLVMTSFIAKEHILLVGPPGCAKSLLLDSLMKWAGGTKFAILLTRYSVPEEVFGPVSLAGLKDDRYLRITTGKLPEADFAYCDEVFKASSAILNTLLRILNERTFDAGDGAKKVPLKLCVGVFGVKQHSALATIRIPSSHLVAAGSGSWGAADVFAPFAVSNR